LEPFKARNILLNKKKCIGCGKCFPRCPHKAILFNPLKLSFSKTFYEKVAEYAYAAQKNKNNIYISFAMNITKGCDCEGRVMKPIVPDLGILASTDPVALDACTLDLIQKKFKKKFRGGHTFVHAKKIGFGSKEYELIEVK